jgi:hypothetical protein
MSQPGPTTIWQFTRYRVNTSREQAVHAARQASLEQCWTTCPALQAAYLLRLGDGDWLDITVWAAHDCAGEAQPSRPAARNQFFEQLDELIGEECATAVAEAPVRQRQAGGPDANSGLPAGS